VTRSVVSFDALDWRQLRHWHVSEARIPAGVELRFREPGVFERYLRYILSAAALFVLQAVLIVG
jgi:hypothetical protein